MMSPTKKEFRILIRILWHASLTAIGLFIFALVMAGSSFAEAQSAHEMLLSEAVNYRAEGLEMQKAGQLDKARTAYQKAIAINPTYTEVYNDLGVIFEESGEMDQAEIFYKKALEMDTGFLPAHSNLAFLYEKMGKIKEAAPHWDARARCGLQDDPWAMKSREKLLQYKFPVLPLPAVLEKPKPKQNFTPDKPIPQKKEPVVDPKEKAMAAAVQKVHMSPQPAQHVLSPARQEKPIVSAPVVRSETPKTVPARSLGGQQTPAVSMPQQKPMPEQKVRNVPIEMISEKQDKLGYSLSKVKKRAEAETVQEIYQRGVALMRLGRYEQAIADFNQVLKLDKDNSKARQALKRAEVALSKLAGSVKTIP